MNQSPKAVALKYNRKKDRAPRVTAKGRGEIAKKIIDIAKENKIPLYEDKHLIQVLEALDVETEIPKLARYVDKLSTVPEVYRDFMCQVIKRCVKLDSWHFDRVSVPCDDITAALKMSSVKLKKMVEALDGYGLGSFSQDFDNRWLVDFRDPGDLVRWCDIATFCESRDIRVERFSVDVSFGLLDA